MAVLGKTSRQSRTLGHVASTIEVRRGARAPYPAHTYTARDVPSEFIEDYWALFAQHGPSLFARYAWQTRRDVTVSEAIGAMKPEPSELWFPELAARHDQRDCLAIPILEWWVVYFWSPKLRQFDRNTRKVLRDAADAAVRRLEEVTGRRDGKEFGRPLTPRELQVLCKLRSGLSEREVARRLKSQSLLSSST